MPNFWRNVIIKNDKWSVINLFLGAEYGLFPILSRCLWRDLVPFFALHAVHRAMIICCFFLVNLNIYFFFSWSKQPTDPLLFDLMFSLVCFPITQLIISSFHLRLNRLLTFVSFCVMIVNMYRTHIHHFNATYTTADCRCVLRSIGIGNPISKNQLN